MEDFDHFIKGLGPHSKHYTADQLRQLHVEVKKLADVLLEAYKAKKTAQKPPSFPHDNLDGTVPDRTIESDNARR